MASKLLKTFMNIDSSRRKIISSLNSIGIETAEDSTLATISEKVKEEAQGYDESDKTMIWHKPESWPDLKEIFDNAPACPIEQYSPYAVILYHDKQDTIALIRVEYGNTNADIYYGQCAYYFSDETFDYDTSGSSSRSKTITHTWDKTKDIDIGETYKVRYVIVYGLDKQYNRTATNPLFFNSNTLYNDSAIGLYVNHIPYTNKTIQLPKAYVIDNSTVCNAIKFVCLDEDVNIDANNHMAPYLDEIEYNSNTVSYLSKIYKLYLGRSQNVSYTINGTLQVNLPNATKIILGDSNTAYVYILNLLAPNLKEISSNNQTYGNDLRTYYGYLPKLDTIHEVVKYMQTCGFGGKLYKPGNLISSLGSQDPNFLPIKRNQVFEQLTELNIPGALSFNSQNQSLYYNDKLTEIHVDSVSGNEATAMRIVLPNVTSITPANFLSFGFAANSQNQRVREIVLSPNFKSDLDISACVCMDRINILQLLDNLPELDDDESYTITLGTNQLNKLTDYDVERIEAKGWVLE